MGSESGARRDQTTTERGRALATKIRTTFEPSTVLEVGDAELVDLDRQGLIASREGDKGFDVDPTPEPEKTPDKVDGKPAVNADETKGA
jgi:hypothetical protein